MFSDLFGKKKQSTVTQLLKENLLFATLTPRELKDISERVYERTYQQDEAIFEQGDRGFGMYIIAQGRVAIQTHGFEGDVQVTTLGAGSFFGELALIDSESLRSAHAVALEQCVLVGFFKADLLDLLESKPTTGVKVLFQLATVLGQRLIESTEKINLLSQARKHGPYYGEAA